MKRGKHSKAKKTTTYIRVDEYTWIEKRIDEPDEVARQRFLMKLAGLLDRPVLNPAS